ncbi:hypothetical protein LTR40_013647, partial [Exophiala xenobiotica]
MFWNSNSLYKLDEERKFPELLRACGREAGDSMRTLINGGSKAPSFRSNASTAVATPGLPSARPGPSASAATLTATNQNLAVRSTSISAPSGPGQNTTAVLAQNLTLFDAFLQTNPGVKYIWVQYLDYTGTLRNRMVTIQQFRKQLATGKYLGCTSAISRLMQDDHGATGVSATGQFILAPDLSTLSLNKGIASPSATVQT